MNVFENMPPEMVEELRQRAEAQSGVPGALLGAGFGVAAMMATLRATGRKPTVAMLLTGAAVGIAYGATDTKTLLTK